MHNAHGSICAYLWNGWIEVPETVCKTFHEYQRYQLASISLSDDSEQAEEKT